MKLPVMIHLARLGRDEFRVIRPARPLLGAVLVDRDRYLNAYLDQDSARRIGGLWLLAARSPRSLIHLPMRKAGEGLDLVLMHHSLQFAPSRWKQVRGRLGPGHPQTVGLPQDERFEIDFEARHHRENRDLFRQHLHAETLFMTGSAKVFRETAGLFFEVAGKGPGFCAEFHSHDGVLGDAREIHIERSSLIGAHQT